MKNVDTPARSRLGRWRIAALGLVAALALPVLPGLAASAAHAAPDTATVTYSGVTLTPDKPLNADGYLPAANQQNIELWNPGNNVPSAGSYYITGFDVAIADGALPGQQFSFTLPEFWRVRGSANMAPLKDTAGNIIATPQVSNGGRTVTFTLTPFVQGRTNISGNFSFQAQEWTDPNRPTGQQTSPIVAANGQTLAELKIDVPAPIWSFPAVFQAWVGDQNTPGGPIDVRSRASWDGKSDVRMTVFAGPGYDFDCDTALNQDPSVKWGIGLVNVGATVNSAPTSEHLLDPSKYAFTCSKGSFSLFMPASSWTSADAETGQVVRILLNRVANGDSTWVPDDAVFAYYTLEQDGRGPQELVSRSPRPGSTGTGTSQTPAPGAFETLVFQDKNGNNVYDEGVDELLPGIEVRVTGTSTTGVAIDTTVTTEPDGRVRTTLPAGTNYTATILNPPAGMTQVTPNEGTDDTIDSDFDNNVATFNVESRKTTTRDAGYFLPMGKFQIKKALSGNAASWVDPETEFTVDYSFPSGPGFAAGSGVLKIKADGTQIESPEIPAGAVVTVKEQAPAAIAGAKWGDPDYSVNGFSPSTGEGTPVVVVTNPIEQQFGAISIEKRIDGNGASLVPAGTVFEVEYSYPAGEHYDAAQGTVEVQADGKPSDVDQIPAGAVVTIKERTPEAVAGTKWTGVVYAPESATVKADETQAFVVTNTAEKTSSTTPTTPTKPAEPVVKVPTQTPELPITGGAGAWTLAALAGALLLGGTTLLIARRRSAGQE